MFQGQATGWGAALGVAAPADPRAPSPGLPGSLEGSPVPSPYPAPPMPPPSAMPFQSRAPMGLAIRGFYPHLPPSPAFEEGPPAYLSEGVNVASEELVRRRFAPSANFHNYRSLIYNIKNRATGATKRLRKVANKERNISNFPGVNADSMNDLYRETIGEITIYNILKSFENHEDYIMPLIDAKSTNRYASLNFSWLNGEDLLTYSQKQGQVLANVLKALRGAAEALLWLAQHGYYHGDIKPDNFFVGADGRVRLMDLGHAGTAARIKFADRRNFLAMVHALGFQFPYQSEDPNLIPFYTAFIQYADALLARAAAKAAAAAAAQGASPSRGGKRKRRGSRKQTKRRARNTRTRSKGRQPQ